MSFTLGVYSLGLDKYSVDVNFEAEIFKLLLLEKVPIASIHWIRIQMTLKANNILLFEQSLPFLLPFLIAFVLLLLHSCS